MEIHFSRAIEKALTDLLAACGCLVYALVATLAVGGAVAIWWVLR